MPPFVICALEALLAFITGNAALEEFESGDLDTALVWALVSVIWTVSTFITLVRSADELI